MSARDRNTIAANNAAIDKSTSWNCVISDNTLKSLEPFSFSDSRMAAADPALTVPVTISVPDAILLTSTIDPAGDFDVYAFGAVAGETYMISVYGSGSDPLPDSVVFLFDDNFDLVDLDDDGGSATNSLLTFTAAYTGIYYIDVEAYPGSGGTGEYTLDVVQQPATDVVDSTFEDAPLINPGVSYGFIDSGTPEVYGFAGETDTYKIEAEAGLFYMIEVAGGADYMSDYTALPPGELDPWIFVYDSEGNLVTQNDDISFPSDISSRVGFYAETAGTYYLDVQSYAPWTGGFSITLQEINLEDYSPLDSINWFNADNIDVGPGNIVKVYFAQPGESWDELADNGTDPLPSFGWNAWEKQQIFDALQEYSKIIGVTYVETTNEAEAEFRLITTTSEQYGAYFYPQDPAFGDAQGIGVFNVDSGGWNFDQQQSLVQGGFAYAVILHEFGHAHGLAHPHDTGGGSEIMLGVAGPFDSYGVYDLNQGVYTVMSYNDAWPLHPDGPSPFTAAGVDNGWSGTLSAFDIAVLQERYGVHAYATGNNVYQLKDVTAQGTYYETIWDSAGIDEIRYSGERNAQIDLTAATLDYSPTGGGAISFVDDIKGGYTIAGGVVIENATGGDGDDVLIGNSAANVLTGNNGDDFLMGGAGNDTLNGGNHGDILVGDAGNDTLNGGNHSDVLDGGADNDTLSGGNHDDVLNGGAGNDILTGGGQQDVFAFTEIGGADRIMDYSRGNDIIDLTSIDAVAGGSDDAFTFIGAAAFSGVAGQLRSYSSGADRFVAGDVDGDAVADFTIQTNILIIASDLML